MSDPVLAVVGPYPLQDAMERLAAVTALREVGTCSDLVAALNQTPRALPAAYLVLREDGHEPRGASGGVLIQHTDVFVCVVLYVNNYRDQATGSAARAEMSGLISAVRTRLLNWRPASFGAVPLSFKASRDEPSKPGTLITQEIYKSHYRIEVRR